MALSPTARTLQECRRRGWQAAVVERWIAQARRRRDAFGCGDVLAVAPGAAGALLIQATSGANMSHRVRKARVECGAFLRTWLRAGNAFEVWGWRRVGGAGGQRRWRARRVVLILRGGNRVEGVACPPRPAPRASGPLSRFSKISKNRSGHPTPR